MVANAYGLDKSTISGQISNLEAAGPLRRSAEKGVAAACFS